MLRGHIGCLFSRSPTLSLKSPTHALIVRSFDVAMTEAEKATGETICPYGHKQAAWVSNEQIYGSPYSHSYMCYLCKDCNAYVGCHRNTRRPSRAHTLFLPSTRHKRLGSACGCSPCVQQRPCVPFLVGRPRCPWRIAPGSFLASSKRVQERIRRDSGDTRGKSRTVVS
jgi:hypothetical protein